MDKRISCRAIIIKDNKMVSMYREKGDRTYYTFPGGGKNNDEDLDACVVREVIEEFGMTVEPIKLVYTYEDEKSVQYFYLCKWVSGEFGSGVGEEFQPDRNKGVYIPTMIDLNNLTNLPLMPPEVKDALYEDFKVYGENLANETKKIGVHISLQSN